jgi:hypothetical protein
MAIVSTDISAKIRVTDSKMKTIATYTGIKPSVDADSITKFSEALGTLRGENVGFKYLVVESELKDE